LTWLAHVFGFGSGRLFPIGEALFQCLFRMFAIDVTNNSALLSAKKTTPIFIFSLAAYSCNIAAFFVF
jgi:hypothetical protein